MNIRTATLQDIDQIAAVEKECFPAAEAATKEEFEQRLSHYADHFWLMFEDDKLIAFVDGMVTDQEDLTDEMYENACIHASGGWSMADDIWCQYSPGISKPRLCRRTFKKSDRRCKRPGKKRSCPYVQRPAGALLCKIWF